MTREETWNGDRGFLDECHYFELLAAPAAVDVVLFGTDGRVIATDKGVKPGYYHDRRGKDPIGKIVITNSASQTVKFIISDGLTGTKSFSPQWYDRNPLTICGKYETGAVAPHAAVQRWSYTVPAGKKSMLAYGIVSVYRDGVAGAAARVYGQIQFTKSGGSAQTLLIANLFNLSVGSENTKPSSFQVPMLAGDNMAGYTADVSASGTVEYTVTAQATEYDA